VPRRQRNGARSMKSCPPTGCWHAPRDREGLVKLPPLTSRYTRIALTQKLRRIIDEGVGYSLALEGSAPPIFARSMATATIKGNHE